MLALLLLSCARAPEPTPALAPPPGPDPVVAPMPSSPALRFVAAAPVVADDGAAVLATATHGGRPVVFGWHPLLRTGDAHGGLPFGTLVDKNGAPLSAFGRDTCEGPDYNALLDVGDQTLLFTHLECAPGALVRTVLDRVPDGGFSVRSSAPVDASPVGGLNLMCSGSVTPWGTVLSAEEYEPDAAILVDGAVPEHPAGKADDNKYGDWSHYAQRARFDPDARVSPYAIGHIIETTPTADGASLVRHPGLGRFSHELAVVMPDRVTVYMTDDQTHGLLAMFVADAADDLSAGTLYASRWKMDADGVELTWVSLGHATNAQITAAIDRGVSFSDLLRRQPLTGDSCPEGLSANRAPQSLDECIAVVPGAEALASRLETRRYAAIRGATTELRKEEGVAVDTRQRKLYVAFTQVTAGMRAGDPPLPGRDHVALPPNPCGAVFRFDLGAGQLDSDGQPIGSAWVAMTGRPVVQGEPEPGGACAESSISAPDNLAFVSGGGMLLIGEDTDRSPNRLWAWWEGLDRPMPIFAAPPKGDARRMAEVSGLSWVPSAGGAGWITISLQHPGDQPATVGLLGPFPTR